MATIVNYYYPVLLLLDVARTAIQ